MKQKELVEAYKVFDKLSNIPMKLITSYHIMKMKKLLENQYLFQIHEEQKYFTEYHGEFIDNGKFMRFPTSQDRIEFNNKINELNDLDIDIEIIPFDFSLSEDLELSAKDIEAIDKFVYFI